MTLPAGARCANHTEQGAVDVCSRCGSFICADCVQIFREEIVYCVSCFERAGVDRASTRATVAMVLSMVSALPVAVGCLLMSTFSMAPAVTWVVSAGVAVSALVLGRLELSAIKRGDAPQGGRGRAGVALWLGAMSVLGLLLVVAVPLVLMLLEREGR